MSLPAMCACATSAVQGGRAVAAALPTRWAARAPPHASTGEPTTPARASASTAAARMSDGAASAAVLTAPPLGLIIPTALYLGHARALTTADDVSLFCIMTATQPASPVSPYTTLFR